ncbi:MAG TPA: ADP-ribosylglycohydrolase family protein [Polyangium sp.]|nr:ADP-ribosylglycohydrolase family protein [Polyangium sp.]
MSEIVGAATDLSTWRKSWARGTLLGLAIGDAFGTTLEFKACEAPMFPTLATGPHVDMTGGGPFSVEPGQVTDDSQMAACLAASLKQHRRFHPTDVAQRYVAWMAHAFDIGNLTHASLAMIQRGVSIGEASRRAWIHSNKQSAGNGSLMRIAPIAVAFADDPEARRMAALADSAITHYDPRCRLACAAYCAALAEAGAGRCDPLAMHAAALKELDDAALTLINLVPTDGPDTERAREALVGDLELAKRDDPGLYKADIHIHRSQGFVRVAFRLAFWELLHVPTFEAALLDTVNRGGDADTNGAIVGALFGARFGESALPGAWVTRVLQALQTKTSTPLHDVYHPRVLVELADAVGSK